MEIDIDLIITISGIALELRNTLQSLNGSLAVLRENQLRNSDELSALVFLAGQEKILYKRKWCVWVCLCLCLRLCLRL